MKPPVLEAREVWLEYRAARGPIPVLRGASLTLARGERVCLVGPSGSGKSSLLMLLAGLRAPTRGQVLHEGRPWPADPDRSAPIRLARFGLIFQEPFLVPYLTIRENALAAAAGPGREARLRELADRLAVAPLLAERPACLSPGERQRASIMRALVNDPEVILADEPTANLDLQGGLEVMRLLTENLGAASLLLATHDRRIIDESATVLTLLDGRLAPPPAGRA